MHITTQRKRLRSTGPFLMIVRHSTLQESDRLLMKKVR